MYNSILRGIKINGIVIYPPPPSETKYAMMIAFPPHPYDTTDMKSDTQKKAAKDTIVDTVNMRMTLTLPFATEVSLVYLIILMDLVQAAKSIKGDQETTRTDLSKQNS